VSGETATRLMTADDVAERWQVPKSHVYRLERTGKLPSVRLGRYRRFRPDAIEEFERDGGVVMEATSRLRQRASGRSLVPTSAARRCGEHPGPGNRR